MAEPYIDSEETKEPEMTRSEKREMALKEKLTLLKEKVASNPPKSIIGKKLMKARLQRLENMAQRKQLENVVKTAAGLREDLEYEKYYKDQQGTMTNIAEYTRRKEAILRELKAIERLDLHSENSIFADQQSKVIKNMPKNYRGNVHQTERTDTSENGRAEELRRELETIESDIEVLQQSLETRDEEYEILKKQMKKEFKTDLSVVKPGLFSRIKTFFREKMETIKQRRNERREKAQKELETTVKRDNPGAGDIREDWLASNVRSKLSLEEQAEFVKHTREGVQGMREEQQPTGHDEPGDK